MFKLILSINFKLIKTLTKKLNKTNRIYLLINLVIIQKIIKIKNIFKMIINCNNINKIWKINKYNIK